MNPIFFVALLAVLGPVTGSLIGVLKKPSENIMFNMLSFAAGVMLAISFMQLIPESIRLSSIPIAIFGLVIGAIFMYGLDKLIPHIHPELCSPEHGSKLKRTAIYLILGIFMHNFPEGMVIAIGVVSDFRLTLAIGLAIAIHNIPEGICTSAPYYYYSKKKLKSILISSSTAIPMLLGFIFAYYIFKNIPLQVVGLLIGATAGLMIYISGDELIPSSCKKFTNHGTIFSLIAGVVLVMLLKLL